MMILLTGGAACGKSYLAEQLVAQFPGKRYYVATMRPGGADGQAKVDKHRAMRAGKQFETLECYGDLAALKLEEPASVVLLECITNLVADELYDDQGSEFPHEQVLSAVVQGIDALSRRCENLIMITNELGSDGREYDSSTAAYIRLLGQANCLIAAQSQVVLEVSAGIPRVVKGGLAWMKHEGEGVCVQ